MAKKTFILGTQSLTSSEDSVFRFGNDNELIIPFPEGIDELEKLSVNFTEKGRIARRILEYLSSFRIDTLLSENGVMQKNGSTLRYERGYRDEKIPEAIGNLSIFDKRRIQIALGLKQKYPNRSIIVVSKRAAFRMKAQAVGIQAQNFKDDTFPSLEEQYKGRIDCKASAEKIDDFYSNGFITKKDIYKNSEIEWCRNLFLNINCISGKKSALARYDGSNIVPLNFSNANPYGISAKNVGQHLALEALLQPSSIAPIVIIKGNAGTGKTFLSAAVALENTYTSSNNKNYNEIIIGTPTETIRGENLGFLPGELEDKYNPYLGGILDNMTKLLQSKPKKGAKNPSKNNDTARTLINKGLITLQMLGYLRGRSISDSFVIIDEVQNIEPSVIKSIVTRAGENSKFVFLGDPTQIDNPELNENYNGLVYLSERMKGYKLCWQVTLTNEESVRSELATLAASIL